jgi:hypothetical protein
MHEVVHTALGLRPVDGYDWIIEGLAEYYSIELLKRGNAITKSRATRAFDQQKQWGERAKSLCGAESTAATTALAVTIFRNLDREMLQQSDGEVNLDALLPILANTRIDLDGLIAATEKLTGATPDTLHSDNLPGCRSMTTGSQEP